MIRPAKIDYSGRTVDLLLLKTVIRPVSDAIVDPNVSTVPMITTGIEKLVQRYALLFLTQIGTVTNSSAEGSSFMASLQKGMIYDENSLKFEAVKADDQVRRQIIREDNELETADDEALENSEIVELGLDRTRRSVTVKVAITSKAGETYTYVTPINIGV